MILRENLSKETAYMLRDDGKLFKLNGAHPYIWGSGANDLYTLFKDNLDDLVWIYNYTENDFTKELMSDLIKYVVEYGKEDDVLPENYNTDYLKNEFSDIDFNIPGNCTDFDEAYRISDALDYNVNNEFIRIRMSDKYFGGNNSDLYIRIKSDSFNWFNLIWKLVNDNKSDISTITIERENESGQDMVYSYKNHKFDHMPVDEFLTLPGNPIIENF